MENIMMADTNTGNHFSVDATNTQDYGYDVGHDKGMRPLQGSNVNRMYAGPGDPKGQVLYQGDQMTLALMTTIFCFCPVGVVAMLRSSEARVAQASNNLHMAQILGRESRRLSITGIIIGSIGWAIFTILLLIRYS